MLYIQILNFLNFLLPLIGLIDVNILRVKLYFETKRINNLENKINILESYINQLNSII